MSHLKLYLLAMAMPFTFASIARGQDAMVESTVKVAIYQVETTPTPGLTKEQGFPISCDPEDKAYRHLKPALPLTPDHVTDVVMTSHRMGASELYMVTIHLTTKAREELAAEVIGKENLMLTVVVNGKSWGTHYYVKDQGAKFAPTQTPAKTFRPSVGFFSSETEAQRLVNALRKTAERDISSND